MKVHFAAAKQRIQDNIEHYRSIVKAIHGHGDNLTEDWLEASYETAVGDNKGYEDLDWKTIYRENMESLARADVVIVDVTDTHFTIGYLVAVGLQHKKPTLILFRDKAIEGTMVSGLDETLVVVKEYNEQNVESIVQGFLEDNRVETKDMRFNFFIDRPIYNYLRWAAYKTGKTKAEILRELVVREIDKANDTDKL